MHIEIGCLKNAYGSRRFDSPEYHIIACSQGTWDEGKKETLFQNTSTPTHSFIFKRTQFCSDNEQVSCAG